MSELSPSAPHERSRPANELLALGVLAAGLIVFAAAAPTAYSLYLMLHIFFAVVWVGGGTVIAILAFMIDRASDPVQIGRFGAMTEKIGLRVFLPSSLIVLALGFALVQEGSWGYGHFWVIFALLGWATSFLVGLFVLTPLAKKVGEVIPQQGIEDPEAQALLRRIITIDRWQVLVLLLTVADMAAKPFSG
jgi:uncharacterized membrane protein